MSDVTTFFLAAAVALASWLGLQVGLTQLGVNPDVAKPVAQAIGMSLGWLLCWPGMRTYKRSQYTLSRHIVAAIGIPAIVLLVRLAIK